MFAVYSSRLQTFFNAMNRQIFTDIARKFDRVRANKKPRKRANVFEVFISIRLVEG